MSAPPSLSADAAPGTRRSGYRTDAGFDAVAGRYDEETERNPVVVWARRESQRLLLGRFPAGNLLLELGCGTGVEAVALARRGLRLVATDPSEAMLARAAVRVRGACLLGSIQLRHLGAAQVASLLAEFGSAGFDGAYSGFGPLNCEPDLGRTAAALHTLIRPGGRLVVSLINRFHPFEAAWYAAHGDFRRASRRWGGYAEGTVSPNLPHRVPTRYYTPRAFARRMAPFFRLVDCRALLLLLPPPYLAHLVGHHPHLATRAARIERRIADWPVLRGLGDHFIMELERV